MQSFASTIDLFSQIGAIIIILLGAAAVLVGLLGTVNIVSSRPLGGKACRFGLVGMAVIYAAGFSLICWFHYQIYLHLPLELPANLAQWVNQQLESMNSQAAYAFPLYNLNNPPRYAIPLWIDNEKYYFWFMCYAIMALMVSRRVLNHRLSGCFMLFSAIQTAILIAFVDPFAQPLQKFFVEVGPWFGQNISAMQRFGLFMKLYPKMIFYYNASYMWLHPPMLFLSYGAITVTFITSCGMLIKRELETEILGYDYAKFGYFMLTLGMLLGYPWALKAWGPNWWWDPKICSSIMMWAIYSTYLHTRLYANKITMWYFTSILGILCFISMLFTFVSSFFFPGEHTFQ